MNSVWLKNGITATLAILAITAGLYASSAHARSSGVGDNTDVEPDSYNGVTCTKSGCHSGGSYVSGSATLAGSQNVAIGSTTAYSVRSANSNAAKNGFSASVRNGSGTRQGTMSTTDTNDVKVGNQTNYVTHPNRRPAQTTFSFNWQAPTSEGSFTLWACVNQVDNASNGSSGDGPAQCGSRSIAVSNTNPVAVDDATSTTEDSSVVINVKTAGTNDSDGDAAVVQSLSVTTVNQPTSAPNGTTSEGADGVVTYNPNNQFEFLDYNDSTTDVFTYVLSDGIDTDTGTVTITVNGVNDPPSVLASAAITYTEVQPPVAKVIDSGITVSDPDNLATIKSATVSITNNQEVEDVLACGTVAAGITCNYVYPTLTLTSASTNSLTQYRNALRLLTFKNTS